MKQNEKPLRWLLVLALVCITGIVGMLLLEGVMDRLGFALAALPLVIGWISLRRHGGIGGPASRGA